MGSVSQRSGTWPWHAGECASGWHRRPGDGVDALRFVRVTEETCLNARTVHGSFTVRAIAMAKYCELSWLAWRKNIYPVIQWKAIQMFDPKKTKMETKAERIRIRSVFSRFFSEFPLARCG